MHAGEAACISIIMARASWMFLSAFSKNIQSFSRRTELSDSDSAQRPITSAVGGEPTIGISVSSPAP